MTEQLDIEKAKMKPCPFCGEQNPGGWERYQDSMRRYQMGCTKCLCLGPEGWVQTPGENFVLEKKVLDLWNNAWCWKEIDELKKTIEKLNLELRKVMVESGKMILMGEKEFHAASKKPS